jgi:hypothetical protein
MSDDVLKEFLVGIGFKVDESSLKKFNTQLAAVEKQVMSIGKIVAGTATAIVAGVAVISRQMENLYYASQRTGETVGNLMALRYAAGQIGLTAEQAQAALEGFTRTLRLNPGTGALLNQLGVTGKGPAEQFESFISKMKQMQPYIAAQYAALFGIDPDTLLMLENGLPKLEAEQQKYKDRLKSFGLNPEQAAEAGKDFDNSIRRLTGDFALMWTVVESKLNPVLVPLIERFEAWAETHADDFARSIASAVQELANWIQSVNWTKVGHDIDSVVKALGGVKGILIALAAIKLAPLIAGVVNLAAAVTRLAGAAAGAGIGALARVLGPLALLFHSSDANAGEGDYLKQKQAAAADIDPNTFDFNGPANRGGKVSPSDEQFGAIIELPPEQNGAPRGIRNNNPGNIRFGKFAAGLGATGKDDKGFAVFSSMDQGIQAALQLLRSYVARGYDTIRTIISRWAPAGENNTSAYIADVAKKLGLSADQHLNADQLGGLAQAIFSHENGAQYARAFGSARIGSNVGAPNRNVTLNQQTTINMSGSSNPEATARAVGSEQRRVNGDLIRNFSGAVA